MALVMVFRAALAAMILITGTVIPVLLPAAVEFAF